MDEFEDYEELFELTTTDEELANITRLEKQVRHLESMLDIYIPLYYSLVVLLVCIAFFVCVLIVPERRRKNLTKMLRAQRIQDEAILKAMDEAYERGVDEVDLTNEEVDDPMFAPKTPLSEMTSMGTDNVFTSPQVSVIEEVDEASQSSQKKEVVLQPRMLPDYQEIIAYDENKQPITVDSSSSNASIDEDDKDDIKCDTLNCDPKRKQTRDAFSHQRALEEQTEMLKAELEDKYEEGENVPKVEEVVVHRTEINQIMPPQLLLTRPSDDERAGKESKEEE